ncbi:MAG: serine/threonine-protein kinase [Planctomycetaceae bacterium]
MSVTLTESDDALQLYDLLEEFMRLLRRKQGVSVREFAARHPDYRDRILADFPALLMAEGLKPRISMAPGTEDCETDQQPPELLAGYRVLAEIGKGGMGVVFRAKHASLSRDLAIKILMNRKGRSDLSERFRREAEAVSKLNHSNIVPVFDFGEQAGVQYLVMPLIDGVSLDQVLESYRHNRSAQTDTKPIAGSDTSVTNRTRPTADSSAAPAKLPGLVGQDADFQEIARLGADVASALAHAHENKTIHRDIKPGNLILDRKGKVWITDFGLAKIRDDNSDLSRTGDIIGTPRFMAPEQMRGLCDERSDIYSLGVTLYEMASGIRAWDSLSQGQLLKVRATAELPELSEHAPFVPKPLADIIMNACSFRPEDRYQTAQELQIVLNRFAHGQATGDRRRRPRVERSFLYRKSTIAAMAVLLPLLTFLAVYAFPESLPVNQKATQEALIALVQDETQREKVIEQLPDIIEAAMTSKDEKVRSQASDLTLKVFEEALSKTEGAEEDKNKVMDGVRQIAGEYRKNGFQYDRMNHPLTNAVRNLDLARQVSAIDANGLTKVSHQVRIATFGELIRRDLISDQQVNELLALLPEAAQHGPTDQKVASSELLSFLKLTDEVFAGAKVKLESELRLRQAVADLPATSSDTRHDGRSISLNRGQLKIPESLKQKIKKAIEDRQP